METMGSCVNVKKDSYTNYLIYPFCTFKMVQGWGSSEHLKYLNFGRIIGLRKDREQRFLSSQEEKMLQDKFKVLTVFMHITDRWAKNRDSS